MVSSYHKVQRFIAICKVLWPLVPKIEKLPLSLVVVKE